MSTASRPLTALPSPVKRLLAAAAAVAMFVGVSAFLNPDRSLAAAREASERETTTLRTKQAIERTTSQGLPLRTADEIRATLPTTRPLIGTLSGSPYYIWVYAGREGPVYTVADKGGRILAVELTAEQLYAELPDASVKDLQLIPTAGNPGPIMLADPAKQDELPSR
jgi:hypothetical protein